MFPLFLLILTCFLPRRELAIIPICSGDVFDLQIYNLMDDD
jgi:hypothetical protein